MFGWFKTKEQRRKEILEAAQQIYETQRAKETAEREVAEKRQRELVEAAAVAQREEDERMRNSPEPWVKHQSIEVDNDGRIAMSLDWNDAFIRYLRDRCRFEGDEDRIVQQWLGALMREIYDDSRNAALDILKQPEYIDENKKIN